MNTYLLITSIVIFLCILLNRVSKAAIEHDKNQRGRAYLFSERVIVEIYLHYSVRAKKHA